MILSIDPEHPSEDKMKKVEECLRDGGTVIYPTDTVYSLGCDLQNQKAMERVAWIQGIKPEKAEFSIVFDDLSHLSDYTKPIDNSSFKLLKKALPGPFTFILEGNSKLPKLFFSKRRTIGIRVPDNPIPRRMVSDLGNPVISSSIHDDDEVLDHSSDPEEIHEKYKKMVDIVINGGIGDRTASTVVDLTDGEPEVVRQGAGDLEAFL
jgi:tRNA threonylcarbamoyl adenosine modification protein (Sua5/YciO/YrdC/YwlC family)